MPLNQGQQTALTSLHQFVKSGDNFHLIEGPAGTGKTFMMKQFAEEHRSRLLFTAPTNKATKVLRDALTSQTYRPETRTIYSALGLKLEANGEVKELSHPEDPLDLTKFSAVVVDEASMVNVMLHSYIERVAETQGLKVIWMGDPFQLPPVGEASSKVWATPQRSVLDEVMRFDNQILTLATKLRNAQLLPIPRCEIKSDNDGQEGVWVMGQQAFRQRILDSVAAGDFSRPNCAKAIAWRNVTVNDLNSMIRKRIFEEAAESMWLPGDRITFLEPAKDLNDETFATTDDEGTVEAVEVMYHPTLSEFKVWRIRIQFDDNHLGVAFALHASSFQAFAQEKERLAAEARLDRKKWKKFWQFCEAFHQVRHGYACTAHRAQGSTYERAFVDYRDILLNQNRLEAFKCLYVAASRPKKELYLA